MTVNGKGDRRRPEDATRVRRNWGRVFRKTASAILLARYGTAEYILLLEEERLRTKTVIVPKTECGIKEVRYHDYKEQANGSDETV